MKYCNQLQLVVGGRELLMTESYFVVDKVGNHQQHDFEGKSGLIWELVVKQIQKHTKAVNVTTAWSKWHNGANRFTTALSFTISNKLNEYTIMVVTTLHLVTL